MDQINGLPTHIILVHAVVVLVPLTALLVLLCVFWPAARVRLVWPTLIMAFGALALTPLTTQAGEWLQRHVVETPLIRTHTQLGDTLIPWTIGLFLVATAIAFLHVRETRAARRSTAVAPRGGAVAPRAGTAGAQPGDDLGATVTTAATMKATAGWERVVAIALPVIAVIVAVGAVITVYRIGDSGAQAVWQNNFSQTATNGRPGG